MISALIGAIIMSAVTVAMLSAIKVSEYNSGKYLLTEDEKQILENAGFEKDIEQVNEYIKRKIKFYE